MPSWGVSETLSYQASGFIEASGLAGLELGVSGFAALFSERTV